jgi:hypothetical protein
MPDGGQRREYLDGLESMLFSLEASMPSPGSWETVRPMLAVLRSLSPKLRPIASGFESVIAAVEAIDSTTHSLLLRVREAKTGE